MVVDRSSGAVSFPNSAFGATPGIEDNATDKTLELDDVNGGRATLHGERFLVSNPAAAGNATMQLIADNGAKAAEFAVSAANGNFYVSVYHGSSVFSTPASSSVDWYVGGQLKVQFAASGTFRKRPVLAQFRLFRPANSKASALRCD
jgi:hypothetical protein